VTIRRASNFKTSLESEAPPAPNVSILYGLLSKSTELDHRVSVIKLKFQ
jgi:hypothetical protein